MFSLPFNILFLSHDFPYLPSTPLIFSPRPLCRSLFRSPLTYSVRVLFCYCRIPASHTYIFRGHPSRRSCWVTQRIVRWFLTLFTHRLSWYAFQRALRISSRCSYADGVRLPRILHHTMCASIQNIAPWRRGGQSWSTRGSSPDPCAMGLILSQPTCYRKCPTKDIKLFCIFLTLYADYSTGQRP